MLVDTIMTRPVVAVRPSMTVREAAHLMVAGRFGGLPVVSDDGRLVGMVSEGDLLRRNPSMERKSPWWLEWFSNPGKSAEDYTEIYERSVEEVMSRGVVTIDQGSNLDDLADLMVRRQVKRVPVVEQGKVVGLVARVDLLKGLARRMPGDERFISDEERMQADVEAAIVSQVGSSFVRPRVKSDAIELRGIIFDEKIRTAALAAARSVAGSKPVKDELVWVEPMADRLILPDG